jgi:Holliday junction resolvase RusA-like endonuclease
MVTLEFAAPPPWSTNQDRNYHPHKRAALIRLWKNAVWSAAEHAGLQPETHRVLIQVTIPFPNRRRRDALNYCGTVLKAAIDGLVSAGVLEDDTAEFVGHLEPVLVVAEKGLPPMCQVHILDPVAHLAGRLIERTTEA